MGMLIAENGFLVMEKKKRLFTEREKKGRSKESSVDMQINKQIEKRVGKKTNIIYRFANKKIIERKNNYNISGFLSTRYFKI